MNIITCPRCGTQTNDMQRQCLRCGYFFQQISYAQPMQQPQNDNLIPCSACGNYVYRLADKCPYCGKPRDRKVISLWFLDIICILSMVFSVMLFAEPNAFRYLGYLIMLFWLIVYSVILWIYKNEPNYDISKVKQSRNAVFIMFLLTYGIGFVIIF